LAGVTVGSPTGGDQGTGTLNATGLFVNGGPVYSGIPQNMQAGSYTLVISDNGKHIAGFTAGAFTWTIPSNASVPFPIGATVTFLSEGSVAKTIAITSDTLIFSPSGSTGSRTLAVNGIATAIKFSATAWLISGSGLT
jgi:hypothetical protein